MKGNGRILLYPAYFDRNKTQREGRRVPRELAVPAPKLADLERAARTLGLQTHPEPEAAYPRAGWEKGRLQVDRKGGKRRLLREIAQKLPR
ncbi:MAG: signal recognition particle protein Srp19 [Euryarchaeota archaeon]|nr:signal recognition particle protein Srp19 [Euryarchaeota archaeon]